MVVLATESTAKRLGLPVQAILAGWALNSDGYHMAMPNGEKIAKCLAHRPEHRAEIPPGSGRLLQRSRDQHPGQRPGRDPGDQGRLSATTPNEVAGQLDQGALGHGLGAASGIEAAVCVRTLREQILPSHDQLSGRPGTRPRLRARSGSTFGR